MANRFRVFSTAARIGGQAIIPLDWSFDLNHYSPGDDSKLTIPLRRTLATVGDLQALSQKTVPLEVEILGAFTKTPGEVSGLKTLFAGPLDCVDPDFAKDTYEITARSWAYQLLTEPTGAVFPNQTTDFVCQSVATKHGLKYDNGGKPSTAIAGKVYEQAQIKSTRTIKEWDLLQSFARAEDRDLFVIGKTLYYVPTNQEEDPSKGPRPTHILRWIYPEDPDTELADNEYALDDLKVAHYAQFSHDAKVVIHNHDPHHQAVTASTFGSNEYAARSASKKTGGKRGTKLPRAKNERQVSSLSAPVIGNKEVYVFNVHGFTPQQVDDFAYAKYKEIAKHELVATVELSGEPSFGIRDIYKVQGTGTISDVLYRPKKITLKFEMGLEGACDLHNTLVLANHIPQPAGEDL
jgi:hypothetical protein